MTVAEASSYQRLREHLAYLGMTSAAEHVSGELDRSLKDKLSPTQVLESLLGIEVEATRARRLRGRLRFAHYPVHKTLADFDFDFQPTLDRKQVAELSTLRFVEERRNVILLGPPGVGKTHIGIALGIAATEAGYRTYRRGAAGGAERPVSGEVVGKRAAETVQTAASRRPSALGPARSGPQGGGARVSSLGLGLFIFS